MQKGGVDRHIRASGTLFAQGVAWYQECSKLRPGTVVLGRSFTWLDRRLAVVVGRVHSRHNDGQGSATETLDPERTNFDSSSSEREDPEESEL
jgi:hypothetical protein